MSTISASTTSTTAFKVTSDTTGTLVFQTGAVPTTAISIDASQAVGIGTSSPGYKLTVAGASGSAVLNLLESGVRSWGVRAGGTATNTFDIADFTAGATRLTIDSSGNLGIGTSSPLRRLAIAGDAQVYNTAADGASNTVIGRLTSQVRNYGTNIATASFASIEFATGTWPTGNIRFLTNGTDGTDGAGTERMRLDSSGNLGLGVTPNAWGSGIKVAQVNFGALVSSATNNTLITSNCYYDGAQWVYLASSSASIYTQSSGLHTWRTAPSGTAGNTVTFSTLMTLSAAGALSAFGTSGNGGVIDIYANGTSSNQLTLGQGFNTASDNVSYIYNRANAALVFGTNNTERMRLDSSGNLGIGTSSPVYRISVESSGQALLSLNSTNANGGYLVIQKSGLATGYIGNAQPLISGAANTDLGIRAESSLIFSTNAGSERARITSGGNLFVGCTAVPSASVQGFCITGTSSGNLSSSGTSTAAYNHFLFLNGNGTVGSISTSGSTTTYSTSSDYRLKNTIAPMTGALAKVALLKPCTYKWNADGSDGQGFIAHELAEVVPQCVTGEKDAVDAEGKPRYQGVDTSFLVATLTAAIQELTARVAQLESK